LHDCAAGGKNETSARIEAWLLHLFQDAGGNIVKCAPTFKPQVINSKMRLEGILAASPRLRRWQTEWSYMLRMGNARVIFFSAEPSAHVVGATAHHLMEFDEAQDIDAEKHDRDFSPMGATTNCTRVYWGTAWSDTTLLQRTILANEEAERKDGVRRNFIYPWEHVAEHVPAYGAYVQAERDRLGAGHPLFLTQYCYK